MSRHNPYDNRLIWFRDYIKGGLDPYDFSYLLPEYAEWYEDNYGEPVPNLDLDEPETFLAAENADEFQTWLEKMVKRTRINELSPAYLTMTHPRLLPNSTWLIHFSNNADAIATNGFLYGTDDMRALAYTDRSKRKEPGWAFASEATSRDARSAFRTRKYGKDAVMFQSAGIEVYHAGDEESQVLVWGPSAHDFILLERDEKEMAVYNRLTERLIFRGDFDRAVKWVISHAAQYRKQVVR